ncbi:translocation/assembly module TamB domain-containing protein [Alsobacter sp. SYSU BS001988]
MRAARAILLGLLGLAALAGAYLAGDGPARAQSEQNSLASLLSWALSTPENRVRVGAVEGALSSDAVIRDVQISDREGVWITLDRARISWRRTALLARRLEIDALEVDRLTVARRPVATETDAAQAAEAPALPALPVKLIVKQFAMKELALGEKVLGQAARIAVQGDAVLGAPAEGLSLHLQATRLDAQGRFAAAVNYVPQSAQLDLNLDFTEPAGGLVASVINLPGQPPIDLKVQGRGPLDGFQASLNFVSGPQLGAQGRAVVTREGAGRRVALALGARIEALLPPVVAPVFAGSTDLNGDVLVGDDGSVAFRQLDVTARAARLTVGGAVDPQQNLDLRLAIRSLPTDGAKTRAGEVEIGRLVLDATAKGPATAAAVQARLDGREIATPWGKVASIAGSLGVEPAAAGAADARSAVAVDLHAAGVAPADAGEARALGDRIDLVAKGRVDASFVADLGEARLTTPTLQASWTGIVGARRLDGAASVRIARLAAFSGLVGRELGGSADLSAKVTGDPRRYRIDAALDGRLADARIGAPPFDRLMAGAVSIKGLARRLPGGLGFSDLRIEGPNVRTRLDGDATTEAANLAAHVSAPDLKRVDERIAGSAELDARLTGSLERPDLNATVALRDARALGKAIPRLVVDIAATNLTGELDARLRLDGEVDRKPAAGRLHFATLGAVRKLDDLDVRIGSVHLAGGVTLDEKDLAVGRIALAAGDLGDLSALALTPLAGKLDASIDLTSANGRQDAAVSAQGDRISVAGQTLRRLDARLTATDLYAAPVVDGTATADDAVLGGVKLNAVRLASRGTQQASAFTLTASGDAAVAVEGRLLAGPPIRVDLAKASLRRNGQTLALAGPSTLTIQDGEVAIPGLAIEAGRGRIRIAGRAGARLALTADAVAVPLSIADIASPGLGLQGVLDAHAELGGTAAAPTGPYRLSVSKAGNAASRAAGVPPIDVKADGRLEGDRATVAATVSAGKGAVVQVGGSVPLSPQGGLALTVRGPLDASLANGMLAAGGQRVTGRLNLDLRVEGPAAAPRIAGTAALTGATFDDPIAGVRLQAIEGRFAARGEDIAIERLTAATRNGGTLSASGRVRIDPAAGFPADVRITGTRAELVSNDTVSATANLALALSGPVARTPRISGTVDVISMDVAIPENLSGPAQPLPGTRHVAPGPAARARLAAARRAGTKRAGPPFVAAFDLNLTANNRIFVRGRGLEAELGGALRLTGTSRDPVAIGAFNLRNGRFDLAGQRIDLVRGRLTFAGDLTPQLDFLAQTQAADVTAQIAVTGLASQPDFAITSTPGLPQDEILSRILFNRAAGGLTGVQALQLAQTIAQLSGGGGPDLLGSLRKSLGADSLDITAGASGGPAVGVTRYINRRVRIGVRAGATAADTGVGVDVDITKNIKLRGQVGADGGASAGAAYEIEY